MGSEDFHHGSEAYVVSRRADALELLGTFETGGAGVKGWTMFATGEDSAAAGWIAGAASRVPERAGDPLLTCGMWDEQLLAGYVPPLENEITEAGDALAQYESSWKHYLDLAAQAAAKADRLGEELLNAGLQADMRSEEARKTLEELCGGVVNTEDSNLSGTCSDYEGYDNLEDNHKVCDPALAHCLPPEMGGRMETMGFVSLGRPACIFRWKGSGRVCACSETEEAEGYCTRACPIAIDDENTDCATLFQLALLEPDDPNAWTLDGGADFIRVEKGLNVFRSEQASIGVPECSLLNSLETEINGGASLEVIRQVWKNIKARGGANAWLNPTFIEQVARGLEYHEDLLYHYEINSGESTLWRTKHTNPNDCPVNQPWNPENTNPINCYTEKTGTLSTWLSADLEYNAPERREWAKKVLLPILLLKFLTYEINGIYTSALGATSYDLTSTHDMLGGPYQGLLTSIATEGSKCSEHNCRCINADAIDASWLIDSYGSYLEEGFDLIQGNPTVAPCQNLIGHHWVRFADEYTWDADDAGLVDELSEFWEEGIPNFLKYGHAVLGTPDSGNLSTSNVTLMWEFRSIIEWNSGWRNRQVWPHLLPTYPLADEAFLSQNLMRPETFIDALRLACYLGKSGSYGCGTNPESLPNVTSFQDLQRLESQVRCSANSIQRKSELLIMAGIPEVIVEGFQSEGMESYFPGYEGRNLELLAGIEADLRRFKTNADSIGDVLFQMAQIIQRIRTQKEQLDIQLQINELQMLRNILEIAIEAAKAYTSGGVRSLASSWDVWAKAATQIGIEHKIDELEELSIALQQEELLSQAISDAAQGLTELRGVLNDIAASYASIQTNLAALRRNQTQAAEAWATMQMLDSDAAGHVLPVNTVMRRRQNTARVRYQKAVERAKKLAYIARRAIEFRFGVDMDDMTEQMTLVPPPAEWAGRICSLQGFDYDRVRDADDPLFDPDNDGSDTGDNYAHMYVGDYVELLSDFVESYAIDYPFSDESDVAVISLRDDIKQATATCEVPSINLLYLSGKIGRQEETEPGSGQFVGWADAGCAADDLNCVQAEPAVGAGLTCDSSFCFGTDPEIFEGDTVGVRLSDTVFNSYTSQGGATVYYTRPSGFENTGYYMQDVGVVNAGEYILSWYDRVPVGSSAVDYMVSLSGTQDATVIQTPTGSWGSRQLHVHVSQPTEMQVQIHPSWTDTQEYGDVWLWGMQLERIGPERCADYGSCSQVPPRPYEETDEDRMTERQDCPDYDGAIMRAEDFRRECVCPSSEGFNSQCDDDDLTSSYRICYWTTTINLTAEGIERGEMIPSNNVAIGNFNYRQDEVAVNLVGTNVKSCEGSSAICNSNAFIPYTLVHQGTVPVRNYHRKTYEFSMPVARVEHGKALAAEVLVTNPPTSTHNQLLGPYFKTGLRGRPLHGTYELRIWETAELNWEAVEDVQLVFKYRYWTRMTY